MFNVFLAYFLNYFYYIVLNKRLFSQKIRTHKNLQIMKRTMLTIVCLLALFASCNKEKTNEKFVGNYAADKMEISGKITIPVMGEQDISFSLQGVFLEIKAGNKRNEVLGYMKFSQDGENKEYEMKGTCTDKVIDFEETTVQLKNISGTDADLTLKVSGVGNLNESSSFTELIYTGTFTGSGSVTYGGSSITGSITDGVIGNTHFVKQATLK